MSINSDYNDKGLFKKIVDFSFSQITKEKYDYIYVFVSNFRTARALSSYKFEKLGEIDCRGI